MLSDFTGIGDLDGFFACGWPVSSLPAPALSRIHESASQHPTGLALLTSCQRIEAYWCAPAAIDCACGAPRHWQGLEALRHLAEVAAGLHSIVLGEDQILGQVRTALGEAAPPIRGVGGFAVAAARRLRQQFARNQTTGQLLDSALALAGVRPGGPITVLGGGAVGRLITARAIALGFEPVTVIARRQPASDWLGDASTQFMPFASLREAPPANVLVACLGSTSLELAAASLPPVSRLIVDLGTPRNVGAGHATPLVNIADLAEAEGGRESQADWLTLRHRLHDILDERLGLSLQGAGSYVGRVRLEVERVRQAELVRIQRLHPELEPETVDTITRALLNQVFHRPSQRLRSMDDTDLAARLAALFAHETPLDFSPAQEAHT